jgi:hypothetical protein
MAADCSEEKLLEFVEEAKPVAQRLGFREATLLEVVDDLVSSAKSI